MYRLRTAIGELRKRHGVAEHSDNWVRVSHHCTCPLCDKPDNCSVSRDGRMVWCGRVSEGSIRQNAGGQFLHRLSEDRPYIPPIAAPPRRPKRPPRDWGALAKRLACHAGNARDELAAQLGVSSQALAGLDVGWHAGHRWWSFPERDGDGTVIGINVRHLDGSKQRLFGSRSGLTFADGWDAGGGPILLAEGGSDTAALMTIGLSVVGRPSNTGGVKLLIDLLSDAVADREIIVVGERDRKPDGRWPGREGAVGTAKGLAAGLQRPIGWALPPDDAKDARSWLGSMPALPAARLADLFVSGLEKTVVSPPITVHPPRDRGPILPVEDWRESMLRARIDSFGHPGYYLDASTTGAGKTHVDFHALMSAFQREGAA